MMLNLFDFKSYTVRGISIVVAILGLALAIYLSYEYANPAPIGCTLTGCQDVRESIYSQLIGVDIPVWGAFFYAGALILFSSTYYSKLSKIQLLPLIVLYTAFGFFFSMYLTYLEVFVIHALCQWCLLSAVFATILFGLSVYWYRSSK